MKQFVALHFLPGAAGHFLSRCLNLLDNTYVWANGKNLPQNLDEKYALLNYDSADINSWLEFELSIRMYEEFIPHWDIDPDGLSICICHPRSVDFIKTRTGVNDQSKNIYIDAVDHLDWCILNGWNKQSYQTTEWFQAAEQLSQDPSVYKIKLSDIINGYEQFLPAFSKLAEFLDRTVTEDIEFFLQKLYNEWFKTTLRDSELEKQRIQIGKIFKNISNDFERNNQ